MAAKKAYLMLQDSGAKMKAGFSLIELMCVFRPKSISHSSSTRSLIPILIRSFIPFLRDH